MTTGRIGLLAAAAAGLLASGLSGCTSPGPIASQRATVSSLKASVSQLEYANDNLKKQVAQLKSDSTRVANELDQEHTDNEELHARLEDAKYAIRKQGGDVTAFNRAAKANTAAAARGRRHPAPREVVADEPIANQAEFSHQEDRQGQEGPRHRTGCAGTAR